MKSNKERIVYLDILNIIAIIAVVALHCNGIVHHNPNIRAWNTSLIVECLFYFAVPLFIMLSGANLMKYREKYSTKEFFKKRAIKVLIPFLFWAIFMFIWKIFIIKELDPISGFKNIINAFFNNKEEATYYFFWCIISIYLTMPFLSLTAKKENKKILWLTVILYFIFNSLLLNTLSLMQITNTQANNIEIEGISSTVLLGGYAIFAILGYLLSEYELPKKYRISIYIGAIFGLIYRYATTFILSKQAGRVVKMTWGYTSWHSILLACSIFLIIKYINFDKLLEKKEKAKKIISKVASCSFGIYLIHLIIMYYEITLLNIDINMWQWRIFGIISTYIISLVIVLLLKKIPIVKKLVP